jgi:ABC-type phosphate transport system substrate-binding protein
MRLSAGLAVAVLLAGPTLSPAADDFVLIVHPSVPGARLRRPALAAIFLRQAMSWGGGQAVVPVDQSGASAVRKAFSDKVLGMPVATALQYWQKQAFAMSPLRPPVVKSSDAEVIAFVAKTEGAVGYVSRAAELPPEVKPIELIE